ncbi:MAG: hypothetical protein HN360_08385 [Rhodospirillaceae bacterium]|jgi:methyl-accepting chemotaxis protein|nr:hypothetical protein [Rhodospirillaceae bacterium]
MGDIGLSTRSSLFVLVGITALLAAGFGLFHVDRELNNGRADLSRAYELARIVSSVKADVWRIRAEASPDTTRVVRLLDSLYQRDDIGPVRESISTLSEALAQYSETMNKPAEATVVEPPDLTGLEVALRTAARNIERRVAKTQMFGLNETITAMRTAELAFIEDGLSEPLARIETLWQEFRQLLSTMPLEEDEKISMRGLIDVYQTSLTAYAKARLIRETPAERGSEILSYMTPSLEGIHDFTDQHLNQAIATETRLLDTHRTLIATGTAALLLILMLSGMMIIRSITVPVMSAASAGRRLIAGRTDFSIAGLGNQDETGDIARAFSGLKQILSETNRLKESLEKARTEVERGEAATAEAAWLRRDLESMKLELDKGQAAVDEVELLRAVIEATKNDIGSSHTVQQDMPPAYVTHEPILQSEPDPAPVPMPLESISLVSQRVAQSSENVTQAALDAERTGILIRNLGDAISGIDDIEALIASIGEQAGMLVVDMPNQMSDLMVLQGGDDRSAASDAIIRRFDIIRTAAGKATWTIRDIATVILEARKAALDIARSSSVEALTVTTELLEQSENLRGMLDQLVLRMDGQLSPDEAPTRKDEPDAS